jgi:large subunit ribosomal protein L25
MSTEFTLNAKSRTNKGKGASRRLRRLVGEIPAIVYGGEKAPEQISLSHKDVIKALENEAFYSHIVALKINDEVQNVIIKDIQRHPAKAIVLHMDFLRVSQTTKLTTKVPLHFINENNCIGVKKNGGLIAHSMTELDIQCLAENLPEYLEVDMTNIDLGQTLHISDIQLPEGVQSVALSHGDDHDLLVVAVNKPKASVEQDDSETSDEDA